MIDGKVKRRFELGGEVKFTGGLIISKGTRILRYDGCHEIKSQNEPEDQSKDW